ncbi:hypothetical protein J6590_025543 [Homalodisca vitripennis]|nr:hypothetical protein J6590_025543 [Homalodisca vitripennis]
MLPRVEEHEVDNEEESSTGDVQKVVNEYIDEGGRGDEAQSIDKRQHLLRRWRKKCMEEEEEDDEELSADERQKLFNESEKKKTLEDEITYTPLQIMLMIILMSMAAYVVWEYEYMHVCALRFYANMGDKDAQHILAQRYYLGKGIPRNKTLAFYWFKRAADQGHGHASYNLGVAHIQGFNRLQRKGEAHDLIKHAASQGIKEAQHILDTACAKGECDR